MSGRRAETIETAVDAGASALLAASAAYASVVLFGARSAVAAAALAFVGGLAALRRIPREQPRFELPEYCVEAFALDEPDELLLTADQRLEPAKPATSDVLELDDVLAALRPDARVVRLFDPAAMPTPGQLRARIERHLHNGTPATAPPDASQALYDALAELRRSLR